MKDSRPTNWLHLFCASLKLPPLQLGIMWPISSELTAGKSVRWSLPQTRRQQRMKASALAALVVRLGVCGWAWSDLLSSHQPHTGADITDVGKCGISVRDHFSFCLNSVQVLRLGTAANEQRSEKAPGSQVLLLEEDFQNYMSWIDFDLWISGCEKSIRLLMTSSGVL